MLLILILLTNPLFPFINSSYAQSDLNLSATVILDQKSVPVDTHGNRTRAISSIGAWVPLQFPLHDLQDIEQMNAIDLLLHQGFDEYYFVMRDFTNKTESMKTEGLLNVADKTELKIFIILLPPSEGGLHANYDWNGWINYFNILKSRHESFAGFVIDDFNAIHGERRLYVLNNMYVMSLSGLEDALTHKREDVQFYPVMYLETSGFETLKNKYNKYANGVILVSTLYQNISKLADNIKTVLEIFNNDEVPKSFKYIVYPVKSGDSKPSDHLIRQTLSIVSKLVDGIIVYVRTDHPAVQNFLRNSNINNNDDVYEESNYIR